ncbi:MAG: RIP metalloprotease RseP [Candidatus Moranbacteria bacterium]|nr:RIP metalloprotease RseP [Candidatus Moranbacteria bacterium]
MAILAFIIILGLLVFVHELGHFLMARFFGVKAQEFGFGFPPRIFGFVYNQKKQKWEIIKGSREVKRKNTIYSLNWIPIGGFVKILGEDGENKLKLDLKKSQDREFSRKSKNFSHKPVYQRIIILAAGVIMNFFAAALILFIGFVTGLPEAVTDDNDKLKNPKIQITEIAPDSPAENMGLQIGDEINKIYTSSGQEFQSTGLAENIAFLKKNAGAEITLEVKRGDDIYRYKGVPRKDPPADQGSLGVALVKTAIKSYPFFQAIPMSLSHTYNLTKQMLDGFGQILGDLIFRGDAKLAQNVAGPIGIVVLTNRMTEMGFAYLVQFTAFLSINLAIINILPFPALDGGRILFLLIEFIKGKPVSSNLEGKFHLTGMLLLLLLMFVVTVKDIFHFQDKFQVVLEKITNLF